MNKNKLDMNELRVRAEKVFAENRLETAPEKIKQHMHELQVHKIELEMQNEELRRMQAELDSTRRLYFELYELAPVGYCTIGIDALILQANLTLSTMLCATKSKIVGQPITRFIDLDDQDTYYLFLKKLANTAQTQSCELRMVKSDGTLFWVRMVAEFKMESTSSVARVTISDITERKRAEKEKEELNTMLEQRVAEEVERNREKDLILIKQSRLAAMGEMISNIAHQWRQPLNALALGIQKIDFAHVTGVSNEAFDKEFEESSMKLINYMSQTIDDFRSFFKPDRQAEVFCVKEQVVKAYTLIKDAMNFSFITVNFELPHYDTFAFGYQNEFKQVILNILSNAKDALEAKESDRVVDVVISLEDKLITIMICDNGGGVPEDIVGKIFDPYFTTKEKTQGTGVGLYMSKMIIEQNMGGKLTVSTTHEGACFEIQLPVCEGAEPIS